MVSRLPTPGSDEGSWGEILNDFLSQSHNPDGSLRQLSQSQIENLTDDLAARVKVTDLASVASTGSYNDLQNKPTIPDVSGLVSDVALDGKTATLLNDSASQTSAALMVSGGLGFDKRRFMGLPLLEDYRDLFYADSGMWTHIPPDWNDPVREATTISIGGGSLTLTPQNQKNSYGAWVVDTISKSLFQLVGSTITIGPFTVPTGVYASFGLFSSDPNNSETAQIDIYGGQTGYTSTGNQAELFVCDPDGNTATDVLIPAGVNFHDVLLWIRLSADNTTVTGEYSFDGRNFTVLGSGPWTTAQHPDWLTNPQTAPMMLDITFYSQTLPAPFGPISIGGINIPVKG